MLLALCLPGRATAQVCDDDAGDEDAGDEDGGLACEPTDSGAPVGEADASLPDGSGFDAGDETREACSCETIENTGAGTIHVCTGGRDRSVCRGFECESSVVRARPCPTRSVELCCEMPARGLYSQLYEDCDHPNCETGFRAQCHDFGGTLREGKCALEETPPTSDGDSGGCSVSTPSNRAPLSSASCLWLVAIALALRGLTRRR
jgi:hypothetical protein